MRLLRELLPNPLVLLLICRILLIFGLIIVDNIIPDHNAEGVELLQIPFVTEFARKLFGTFAKWDSIHFLTIATNGYQKDYQFAFYPLFPMILRWMSGIHLVSFTGLEDMILFGLIFNMLCSIGCLLLLRKILQELRFLPKFIDLASICFILNPATIFFTTIYTESLFSFLSWLAFYLFLKFPGRVYHLFPLIACCCVRSNGMLAIIPICGTLGMDVLQWKISLQSLLSIFGTAIFSILPFLCFSLYAFQTICHQLPAIDAEVDLFCQSGSFYETYSFLQGKYWNVSFMSSYQFRQIPNILLAMPIFYVSLCTLSSSFHKDREPPVYAIRRTFFLSPSLMDISSDSLLPWKLHLLVTMLLGMFLAHIQISTRLICSSSPLVYVGLAQLLVSDDRSTVRYTQAYLFLYAVIGSILHTNFLPWT